MAWNLENLNPATRFYYYEDGKKTKEWVELRLASDDDNKKFFNTIGVREKIEKIFNPKTRQMERMTYFDTSDEQRDLFNEEVWDFSISDWGLFSTEKDESNKLKPIPCTRENKIKFMRSSPKFANWVAKCLENLREALEAYTEDERKNS
jgi:hypothetical protein